MHLPTIIERPRKVLIIGGSLGGLAMAVALKRSGFDVEVFERSPPSMTERGAGLVMQPATAELLERFDVAYVYDVCTRTNRREYLNKTGEVETVYPGSQYMISWTTLFHVLHKAIPENKYHFNKRLASFKQDEKRVVVRFEDGTEAEGDMLIGADGVNSIVRRQLLPEVRAEYSGYVAWRGVILEKDATPLMQKQFLDTFTFFQLPNSHALAYPIPGEDDSIKVGERRINWLWYKNVPEGPELRSLLTDRHGKTRPTSVPPGGELEEVGSLVLLQSQGAGDRIKHLEGHVDVPPLL